jgi:hypothetical protein
MAAGIIPTKLQLDDLVGNGARTVRLALERVKDIKEYLDTKSQADLETEFSYSPTDAANIKSAYADLAKLAGIFEGTQTQSPAYDFRTFARRLWGLGVIGTSGT